MRGNDLVAVAVDSLLDFWRQSDSSKEPGHSPALRLGLRNLRLSVRFIGRLESSGSLLGFQAQPGFLASLGIPFRLGWAGLDRGRREGRRFAPILPLVRKPACTQARAGDGKENGRGDEPLLPCNAHFAPHYNHGRSKAYA